MTFTFKHVTVKIVGYLLSLVLFCHFLCIVCIYPDTSVFDFWFYVLFLFPGTPMIPIHMGVVTSAPTVSLETGLILTAWQLKIQLYSVICDTVCFFRKFTIDTTSAHVSYIMSPEITKV